MHVSSIFFSHIHAYTCVTSTNKNPPIRPEKKQQANGPDADGESGGMGSPAAIDDDDDEAESVSATCGWSRFCEANFNKVSFPQSAAAKPTAVHRLGVLDFIPFSLPTQLLSLLCIIILVLLSFCSLSLDVGFFKLL